VNAISLFLASPYGLRQRRVRPKLPASGAEQHELILAPLTLWRARIWFLCGEAVFVDPSAEAIAVDVV
jgi:hypothetical protein